MLDQQAPVCGFGEPYPCVIVRAISQIRSLGNVLWGRRGDWQDRHGSSSITAARVGIDSFFPSSNGANLTLAIRRMQLQVYGFVLAGELPLAFQAFALIGRLVPSAVSRSRHLPASRLIAPPTMIMDTPGSIKCLCSAIDGQIGLMYLPLPSQKN